MGARGKMESGALYLRRLRLEDGAANELEGGGTGCSPRCGGRGGVGGKP